MNPQLFGTEHILYIVISTLLGGISLFAAKKWLKGEKSIALFIKIIAFLLLASIMANRLSQVFRYDEVRWYCIIPDSICGMTSLVFSLAALFGKKNNAFLHPMWLLGLFGGVSTVIYATFVGQGPTLFYLPTITGLLHHSLSALLAVAVLMLGYINITYKKWHYTLFGVTAYVTLGAFLMQAFDMSDAFHIAEPLLEGTPLTIWVMAPIYLVCYGVILAVIEAVRKHKNKDGKINEN